MPGRGAALAQADKVAEGIAMTRDFVSTLFARSGDSVAKGRSLKEAFDAAREVMDPKFASFAIMSIACRSTSRAPTMRREASSIR